MKEPPSRHAGVMRGSAEAISRLQQLLVTPAVWLRTVDACVTAVSATLKRLRSCLPACLLCICWTGQYDVSLCGLCSTGSLVMMTADTSYSTCSWGICMASWGNCTCRGFPRCLQHSRLVIRSRLVPALCLRLATAASPWKDCASRVNMACLVALSE